MIRKVVQSLQLAQKLEALTASQHTKKKERINEVLRSLVIICSSRIEGGEASTTVL